MRQKEDGRPIHSKSVLNILLPGVVGGLFNMTDAHGDEKSGDILCSDPLLVALLFSPFPSSLNSATLSNSI